jgi:protein AIR1/2
MEDSGKEIIDLTNPDDREVIILDSDLPSPPSSKSRVSNDKRKATREEDTEVIAIENDLEQSISKSSKKSKRTRKKRKRTVVGAEDGEIVEVGTVNTSAQVSGEGSSDKSEDEEQHFMVVNPAVKQKKRNGEERISLLARLSTIPVTESQDVASEPVRPLGKSKGTSKAEKKRKKREQQREPTIIDKKNPIPSSDEPPPYFIDDRPSDTSTFATALPPPVLLASSAVVESNHSTAEQETTLLLLPPHVSVIEHNGDTPIVEIKAPVPDDSEDGDYIDYVQYDDDQVVSTIVHINHLLHVIFHFVERDGAIL